MTKWNVSKERAMEMVVRRTKEEWTEIIEAYRQSGQSQTAFCREHGLSAKTLGAHIRKSKVREGATQKAPIKRSPEEWARLISEQDASGMSRAAWCRKHGVSPDSMTSAEKRLKAKFEDRRESEWLEFRSGGEASKPGIQKGNENSGIMIRSGGVDIEVSADYPVEKLAILIGKLVKMC
jgi:transposase-like protein